VTPDNSIGYGGMMDNIFKLQADVCKIFANDKRLEIINLLKDREMSNQEIMRETGLNKVNVSQHVNILKSKGVIISRREGQQLFYRIANPKIIQACTLMREVLVEQHLVREKVISRMVKASRNIDGHKSVKRKVASKRS
jgi:ArsR family transcriptional regulator, virulence genes transcriptional regulator